MVLETLAEEYSEVVQKAENAGCALEYAAERFLSKFVGDKPGFFLAAHNKMCEKLDRTWWCGKFSAHPACRRRCHEEIHSEGSRVKKTTGAARERSLVLTAALSLYRPHPSQDPEPGRGRGRTPRQAEDRQKVSEKLRSVWTEREEEKMKWKKGCYIPQMLQARNR